MLASLIRCAGRPSLGPAVVERLASGRARATWEDPLGRGRRRRRRSPAADIGAAPESGGARAAARLRRRLRSSYPTGASLRRRDLPVRRAPGLDPLGLGRPIPNLGDSRRRSRPRSPACLTVLRPRHGSRSCGSTASHSGETRSGLAAPIGLGWRACSSPTAGLACSAAPGEALRVHRRRRVAGRGPWRPATDGDDADAFCPCLDEAIGALDEEHRPLLEYFSSPATTGSMRLTALRTEVDVGGLLHAHGQPTEVMHSGATASCRSSRPSGCGLASGRGGASSRSPGRDYAGTSPSPAPAVHFDELELLGARAAAATASTSPAELDVRRGLRRVASGGAPPGDAGCSTASGRGDPLIEVDASVAARAYIRLSTGPDDVDRPGASGRRAVPCCTVTTRAALPGRPRGMTLESRRPTSGQLHFQTAGPQRSAAERWRGVQAAAPAGRRCMAGSNRHRSGPAALSERRGSPNLSELYAGSPTSWAVMAQARPSVGVLDGEVGGASRCRARRRPRGARSARSRPRRGRRGRRASASSRPARVVSAHHARARPVAMPRRRPWAPPLAAVQAMCARASRGVDLDRRVPRRRPRAATALSASPRRRRSRPARWTRSAQVRARSIRAPLDGGVLEPSTRVAEAASGAARARRAGGTRPCRACSRRGGRSGSHGCSTRGDVEDCGRSSSWPVRSSPRRTRSWAARAAWAPPGWCGGQLVPLVGRRRTSGGARGRTSRRPRPASAPAHSPGASRARRYSA